MAAAITFRNVITDARRQVEIQPGQTVRQLAEHSGLAAPGSDFSVRDQHGQVVDDRLATDFADAVLMVGLQGSVRGGGTWITIEEVAAGFLALRVLGPFAEAFASKLGDHLGESTASAISKVRLFRRRQPTRDELVIRHPNANTFIVLPGAMTDEACLGLIDLDLDRESIRGSILHWDPESAAWCPIYGEKPVGATGKIVFHDATTETSQEAEARPDMNVRHVVERGEVVKLGTEFIVTDSGGTVVDDFPSIYFVDKVLTIHNTHTK